MNELKKLGGPRNQFWHGSHENSPILGAKLNPAVQIVANQFTD